MFFLPSVSRAVETDAAVQDLIERIAPGHVKDFVIDTIVPPAGENVFEVEGLAWQDRVARRWTAFAGSRI